MQQIDQLCVNTLRFLAVDEVEAAKSGHPGLPLGAAPMAYVLWDRIMRHNPAAPSWFNRDRFVLSPGHGSALLYALLHLFGYGLTIDDLKQFRQVGSKTPGHPEYGVTTGVEATTGPLGQGFAMGVGMAIAEAHLAATLNRPSASIIDHYTYAIVSDGDLMEGVSAEAASLAGSLKLGKLIYLYDDNHISIEGGTDLAFTENVMARFQAYGWHTQTVDDGNDLDAIEAAVRTAQTVTDKPSIIAVRTHIGFGSPKQDSASAHGEPLGPKAAEDTKKAAEWPIAPAFYVPEEARQHCTKAAQRGAEAESQWKAAFASYEKQFLDVAGTAKRLICGELPANVASIFPTFETGGKAVATRSASGTVMNAIADSVPELFGGSADLAPSTKTRLTKSEDFSCENRAGRNMHFGIREFAMGAIMNGMALHGGVIPYGSTFLVFSDYMRASIRLAALMKTHTAFVFTHDSIGVGEDGPTHQPIEQVMSMRTIPGLTVVRPADANETSAMWKFAVEHCGPTVMALSRQNLPVLDASKAFAGAAKGAYALEMADKPDVVLIGSGSEVHVAIEAAAKLRESGLQVQVVSMPSWELFGQQSEAYKRSVLPAGVPKVAIEAGVTLGWERYTGTDGAIIGIDRFGESGPGNQVMKDFGFSAEHVCKVVESVIDKKRKAASVKA